MGARCPDLAERPDFADRAIVLTLPPLGEGVHITEKEFWANFDKLEPTILGALLDAVSSALRNRHTVQLSGTPRMADFALWVEAAAPALGWDDETFLSAYTENRKDAVAVTFEADIVATAVREFVEREEVWRGTASQLLEHLNRAASV